MSLDLFIRDFLQERPNREVGVWVTDGAVLKKERKKSYGEAPHLV